MRQVDKDTAKDILSLLQLKIPKTQIALQKKLNRRTIWKISKHPEKYLLDKVS